MRLNLFDYTLGRLGIRRTSICEKVHCLGEALHHIQRNGLNDLAKDLALEKDQGAYLSEVLVLALL